MYTAGIDLGSATGKAVIMRDGEIVGHEILPSQAHPDEMARRVLEGALGDTDLDSADGLENVVATGYGRLKLEIAAENVSEISCHAKGAHFLLPSVRTIVDIGGQDCKVISINPDGTVDDFTMNDRCAAGTGRFFEGVARGLGVGIDGISSLENQGEEPCNITNQCSVFAESEVITLVNEGHAFENIIAGVNISVARRIRGMARKVGVTEDVVMTGGCSKNEGLAKAIGDLMKLELKLCPVDRQLAGAIGAALFAAEKKALKKREEHAA